MKVDRFFVIRTIIINSTYAGTIMPSIILALMGVFIFEMPLMVYFSIFMAVLGVFTLYIGRKLMGVK